VKYTVEFESEAELLEFLAWKAEKYNPKVPESGFRGSLVSDCYFSTRVEHAIKFLGIKTVGELLDTPDSQFLRCQGFGKMSLKDMKSLIKYNQEMFEKELHKHK